MALSKLQYNSLNVTPSASKGIRFNSGANGFEAASAGGNLTLIKTITLASAAASISFVDGASDVVLDGTYKEYIFYFNNIHPETNAESFKFNGSSDTGSNYNVTKTTSFFRASADEADSSTALGYRTGADEAQGTGFQTLMSGVGGDNDQCGSGYLHLFDPSSTTFVKHFMARATHSESSDYAYEQYMAGYFNTTSAVDAIQFKFGSGNIDAGSISMYGVL